MSGSSSDNNNTRDSRRLLSDSTSFGAECCMSAEVEPGVLSWTEPELSSLIALLTADFLGWWDILEKDSGIPFVLFLDGGEPDDSSFSLMRDLERNAEPLVGYLDHASAEEWNLVLWRFREHSSFIVAILNRQRLFHSSKPYRFCIEFQDCIRCGDDVSFFPVSKLSGLQEAGVSFYDYGWERDRPSILSLPASITRFLHLVFDSRSNHGTLQGFNGGERIRHTPTASVFSGVLGNLTSRSLSLGILRGFLARGVTMSLNFLASASVFALNLNSLCQVYKSEPNHDI